MPPLPRRAILAGAVGATATRAAAAQIDLQTDWAAFAQRYLHPSGRVVDTGNRGVSHSEGQGYALLAAVRSNDQPSFERILNWTVEALRRPHDRLLAWRWRPDTDIPVDDLNNATDGDIFVAWALSIAGDVWRNPSYRRRAEAMARDILRRCIVPMDRRWVLLPGAYGFRNAQRTVVNLSYYTLPALRGLSFLAPDPAWRRVEMDFLALLGGARFGAWRLPPDWLEFGHGSDAGAPAQGWPARFSFDAVRIPLNLCWAGLPGQGAAVAARRFWLEQPHQVIPAWVDLRTGHQAPFPASTGVTAIARLTEAAALGHGSLAAMPRVEDATDYYSASLTLLARIAWHDLALSPASHSAPPGATPRAG
jgi:endoglucanase